MAKGRLSATNLASYHHLNCDLYLHNTYHRPASQTAPPHSQIAQAHFSRGNDWEDTLFRWLDNYQFLLTVPSVPPQPKDLVGDILADSRGHFFISGLTLRPPQEAFEGLFQKEGTEKVTFSLAKPDLVEIYRSSDGRLIWRVIDAKSSENVKASHYAQIYFYTLCLTYILPQPQFRPSGYAAIWLPPSNNSNEPSFSDLRSINLSLLAPSLQSFIFGRLPRLLSQHHDDVEWHYNPLCRNCPYNDECRSRSLMEGTVGSIPNISHADAHSVKNLLDLSRRTQRDDNLSDIEELHTLFRDEARWRALEEAYPTTFKKSTKVLGITRRKGRTGPVISFPALDAARSGEIQVTHRRSFTCPQSEDVAIVISLLRDPTVQGTSVGYFCVSTFSNTSAFKPRKPATGPATQLVPSLAALIQSILLISPVPSTQFYVFSTGEHAALQSHLVDTALMSTHSDADIRLCIGALASGASLLRTAYQPLVLSGTLLSFLSHGYSSKSEAELQICAERLGLKTTGSMEELRSSILAKLEKLKDESNTTDPAAEDEDRRILLGQLPRVVTLKPEIERLLALPLPGYWDLEECAKILVSEPSVPECPTDDEIMASYKSGAFTQLESYLKLRNWYIHAVLSSLRRQVSNGVSDRSKLLVNPGRRLSADCMDICKDEHLRKLFFMQQFEVLARLTELWKSRIGGCPDAPVIEYRSTVSGGRGPEHLFIVVSGSIDMAIDKERSFYDYILVRDNEDDSQEIPIEALFDDLGVASVVFPLNKSTRALWDLQNPVVRDKLALADIQNISTENCGRIKQTMLTLQVWIGGAFKLEVGQKYRLSPRLVDFNVTKVLTTLFELDVRASNHEEDQSAIPFWQLIKNPQRLRPVDNMSEEILQAGIKLQRMFRELYDLGSDAAGALILQTSQQQAAKRILTNRLAVVWGPPGTGKTHTIALSILRLLDAERKVANIRNRVFLVSAMTHAAIQACLDKLTYLISCYKAITHSDSNWLDDIRLEKVVNGNTHPPPRLSGSTLRYIYAGTVYQLYNFNKRHSLEVDVVVIDEAGQLGLALVALVLRALKADGKMIFAGDSEQLAPILAGSYPITTKRLFGSILDYLMQPAPRNAYDGEVGSQGSMDTASSQGSIVQLTENFRLNPDLGDFISTIYRRSFKPQKSQTRELALRFRSIEHYMTPDTGLQLDIVNQVRSFLLALSDVMLRQPQNLLLPPTRAYDATSTWDESGGPLTTFESSHLPISLAMIQLETNMNQPESAGYEMHVQAEAAVAAALVTSIQQCAPDQDIFVATPYRVQRQAVKSALEKTFRPRWNGAGVSDEELVKATSTLDLGDESGLLKRVTVDTIERLQGSEADFVICLFSVPPTTGVDVSFLLERRRLNVAISRAKTLCILVTSAEVLRPTIRVLTNEGAAKGYAFLRAFEERAWSGSVSVNLDAFSNQVNTRAEAE